MKKNKLVLKKGAVLFLGSILFLCMAFPGTLWAKSEVDELREQLSQLSEMMQNVEQKIVEMEKQNAEKESEIEEMDERLNDAEMHTSTDRLSLGIELRSRGDSIHYQDMLVAPDSFVGNFFTDYVDANNGGFNNATAAQIQERLNTMGQNGEIPAPEKQDVDNDILFTNRFRINMKSKINSQLAFAGRLSAYKTWGDSSGVKYYQGSMGDVSLDGTTSSRPNGDGIHMERAYFNYKNAFNDVPINFSLGRRPSTDGPPLEYSQNSLEGGSPLAHIINWQFDGASLNFGLEEKTGIPGSAFKLCYGVGFESGWGNSSSFDANSQVDDVHLFGVITDLYDNDTTSVVANYAHAFDLTDGFTGQTVMPFVVTKDANGNYNFEQNTGSYISRTEPVTNLGDWDALTLLFRHNFMEQTGKDIDFFMSLGWSHTSPDKVSANPYYELMGEGLLSSNGDLQSRNGYSLYAGAIFPMPLDAKLGIEYNWGSQYWFNFTGAEDTLLDSKLAARGQVWEVYYIQPIMSDNFFVTLGGRHYNYDYTGSGNPLGAPVDIDEASSMNTLFPVTDKVWNAYISATVKF